MSDFENDCDKMEKVLAGLAKGLGREKAARVAGLQPAVFLKRIKKGEKHPKGKYGPLAEAVKTAEAKCEAVQLERIHQAAEGGSILTEQRTVTKAPKNGIPVVETTKVEKELPPQLGASTWILERLFPERYGKKKDPEIEKQSPLPLFPADLKKGHQE